MTRSGRYGRRWSSSPVSPGSRPARPCKVRVGIATGLVVVGDLIGSGAAQEQAVVGETPNLAARLQAEATPGTVAIDQTHPPFAGRSVRVPRSRRHRSEGLRQSGASIRGGAPRAWSRAGSRRCARRRTPLVGRDEEIELLLRRWEQAKSGDGCVVLISGEPGIGKSRIAETIVERLGGEPYTRLRYFCSPHHQDSALYPSIAQLERAAGFRREDTAEQRLAKLEAVLAQGTNDLSEAVPLLADLLSIPTGDRYPPLNLTPQKRKEKTLHAQLAQLEGLAARQPVLMVWEDLHWSDPTTRESLDLLIDRVLHAAGADDPHLPAGVHAALDRAPPCDDAHAQSPAAPAGRRDDRLRDRRQGAAQGDRGPDRRSHRWRSAVHRGADQDRGRERHGRPKQVAITRLAGPVAPLAIPTSLQASLLARLDRLAPSREVAQIGAALGRSFSHELISAVAGMPQQQLDDALEQLCSAELIFRRGDAARRRVHVQARAGAGRRLQHACCAAGASSCMPALPRRSKSRFSEIVAAQPASWRSIAPRRGSTRRRWAIGSRPAGRRSARSAMTEAVAQLRKGLDLLSSMPEDPCRTQQELDLQIALGQALIATNGYSAPAVAETIVRARALAKQLDRSDYSFHCSVHNGISTWPAPSTSWRCRWPRRWRNSARPEAMRPRGCWGIFPTGSSCFFLGEITAAHARFEQSLGLSDPAHRALNVAGQYAGTLVHLATTLAILGYIDQARSRVEEAVWSPAGLGTRSQRRRVVLGVLDRVGQRFGSCAATARGRGHSSVERTRFSVLARLGACMPRVASLSALGQGEEGLRLVTRGLSLAHDTGGVVHTPWALTLLAEARPSSGIRSRGWDTPRTPRRLCEKTDERFSEAELHRVRGELLGATGDEARPRSKAMKRRSPSRNARAREYSSCVPPTSLARLWRDQAKGEWRPAICWRRSTIGSLKVSTRRFCKARRRCPVAGAMRCQDRSRARIASTRRGAPLRCAQCAAQP